MYIHKLFIAIAHLICSHSYLRTITLFCFITGSVEGRNLIYGARI